MPAMKVIAASSLALSLAPVCSVRQRLSTESGSAVRVVEAIGDFLQQRNLGTEDLIHQIMTSVTPQAEESFAAALKAGVATLEANVEKKIKDGQAATQSKLDSHFQTLNGANTAANEAKTAADQADQTWFECAAAEQAKRQAAEGADKKLSSSRSNENEACQLQQDNKGFEFDATGKYTLEFDCDFGTGDCDAAYKKWEETVVKKIQQDATDALAKDESEYATLKSTCESKKQERVAAQSSLDSAESAWNTQRATCQKLATQRQSAICTYGSQVQAKCAAEGNFKKLVASTKKAEGGPESQADRAKEWLASGMAKCMMTKSIAKGLEEAFTQGEADACASQVKFSQDVAPLNLFTKQEGALAVSNQCADAPITFYNGQTWAIPSGDKPQSSAYARSAFTPQLNPAAGNFEFCQ